MIFELGAFAGIITFCSVPIYLYGVIEVGGQGSFVSLWMYYVKVLSFLFEKLVG